MRWPEDEIGPEITVVREWACFNLSAGGWYRSERECDEEQQQISPALREEKNAFVMCGGILKAFRTPGARWYGCINRLVKRSQSHRTVAVRFVRLFAAAHCAETMGIRHV